VVHSPAGGLPDLGVVIVVGGPQYRVGSHRQFVQLARALAAAGYAVLRFDYRGMGDSAGAVRNFEQVDADIRAAIDALLGAVPTLRSIALWGLCDAASAVLTYCDKDPRVSGILLANPWVRTPAGEAQAYLRHYYLQRLLEPAFWRKIGSGAFNVRRSVRDLIAAFRSAAGGTPAVAEPEHFLDRMLRGLSAFDQPIQVLLSERDLTAQEFADRCQQNEAWRRAIRRPNVVVTRLPSADHTFSTRAALEHANAESLAWLERVAEAARGSTAGALGGR
jgi:exosortase A-associated hydrolase 1